MAQESEEFGKRLESEIKIPIVFQDETLSTKTAQELSINANIKKGKRKAMEDAFSAAVILQEYIESARLES
jgi:putative Holliday junction resolvase